MNAEFPSVFSALRDILRSQRGNLVAKEDSASCYCLQGGIHPTLKRPFPVAWVTIGKNYVSFHHMGIYVKPDLLKKTSKQLRARMQGKSCFNFSSVDQTLFDELEELTARSFEVFRSAPFIK